MADFIVVTTPVIQTLTSDSPVIETITSDSSVIETITSDSPVIETITSDSPVIQTLTSALQGPPGPQGIQGITGGSVILQLTACANLGGNRAVTGSVHYADNTDLATVGRLIGITTGAANTGTPVDIIVSGELDGFSGFTVNEPVYLSANGTLTQTIPTSGYVQKVGIPLTNTILLVSISEPLVL